MPSTLLSPPRFGIQHNEVANSAANTTTDVAVSQRLWSNIQSNPDTTEVFDAGNETGITNLGQLDVLATAPGEAEDRIYTTPPTGKDEGDSDYDNSI